MLRQLVACASLIASLCVGCAGTRPTAPRTADVPIDQVPELVALEKQANRRPVHSFRKPVRDRRVRAQRAYEAEYGEYLAALKASGDASALTGSQPSK